MHNFQAKLAKIYFGSALSLMQAGAPFLGGSVRQPLIAIFSVKPLLFGQNMAIMHFRLHYSHENSSFVPFLKHI